MDFPWLVEWDNLQKVIEYANKIGRVSNRPLLVIKYPTRDNYNICRSESERIVTFHGAEVLHRTGG